MGLRGAFSGILALLAAALIVLPSAAQARVDKSCSAALDSSESLADQLDQGINWTCPASLDAMDASRQALRFDLADLDPADRPAHLVSRIAAFGALSIAWQGDDGHWQTKRMEFGEVEAAYLDRQFAAPLPHEAINSDQVIVAIDEPTQAIPLDYARLEKERPGYSESDRIELLLIAMALGMVLMPLLFDAAFYRVLREPFILWHAAFTLCMAMQLVFTAGLYLTFVSLSVEALRFFTVGSFALMVCTAAMFFAHFIERDCLSPAMRRALTLAGCWMLFAAVIHAPGFDAFGPWPAILFYLSGAPIATTFVFAAWKAWRAGSIYVRYLAIGLTPLFLVAIVRVASFALPGVVTHDMNTLFHVGVVVEVAATALGVATRFLAIKRERDQATTRARALQSLAERDPLTGLLNRRAIEPRFAELHTLGFSTFAVLDLDRFKSINDTHGHTVGDLVLQAVAATIDADEDALAARLGGEEFVLLMRGDDAPQRAERLRQAIPARVARDVDGLGTLVTASMGMITAPRAALPTASFADLYAQADKLLYEAKGQGRNRTVSEQLRAFRRQPDRRKRVAA